MPGQNGFGATLGRARQMHLLRRLSSWEGNLAIARRAIWYYLSKDQSA